MKKIIPICMLILSMAFVMVGCSETIDYLLEDDSATVSEVGGYEEATEVVEEPTDAAESEEGDDAEDADLEADDADADDADETEEEDLDANEGEDGDDAEDADEADAEEADDNANYVEYEFRSAKLLNSHYEKHGIEMGFASAEEYEDAASDVVNNPDALHKTEAEDGDDVYYVEATNEFVVVSTDGYIRTYFNPSAGIDYYNRQ